MIKPRNRDLQRRAFLVDACRVRCDLQPTFDAKAHKYDHNGIADIIQDILHCFGQHHRQSVHPDRTAVPDGTGQAEKCAQCKAIAADFVRPAQRTFKTIPQDNIRKRQNRHDYQEECQANIFEVLVI